MPRMRAACSRVSLVLSTPAMCAFQCLEAQRLADARRVATCLFAEPEVVDLDHLLRADDACPLHHVAQFAHVAGPAIALSAATAASLKPRAGRP